MSDPCRGRPVQQIPILIDRNLGIAILLCFGAVATQPDKIMSRTIARIFERRGPRLSKAKKEAARTNAARLLDCAPSLAARAALRPKLNGAAFCRMMLA